jgi:NNP family nitrate/nitrite transporter-like MFS transporter
MLCVVTGVLVAAAIPTALAGTIQNYAGLMLIRFFVGIAGASFVPTLNWCTMFYDKNVVGTGKSYARGRTVVRAWSDFWTFCLAANGFAGGWGNGGSAIAFFMMPAVYDSLRGMGRSSHVAWRLRSGPPT